MKKFIQTLTIVSFSLLRGNAQYNQQSQAILAKQSHHFFIENKGQWPKEVLYLTRINGLDAWITKQGILYTFYKIEENAISKPKDEIDKLINYKSNEIEKNSKLIGHRVWMKLQHSNNVVIP